MVLRVHSLFSHQVVPVDAAGRVSVLELTASLEGAILSEGKTQAGVCSCNVACPFVCLFDCMSAVNLYVSRSIYLSVHMCTVNLCSL